MDIMAGTIMIAVGIIFLSLGGWLIKRFDKQVGFNGFDNSYLYNGILSTLGILGLMLGGFCIIFGIAMIII